MNTEQLLQWKNQGLTLSGISDLTGINYSTLKSRYSAAGIEFNRWVNPWCFDKVTNIYDADGQYLIGLLAADGYLGKRSVEIYIQEKDIELLYRVRMTLCRSDANVLTRITAMGSKQVGLIIGSVDFKHYLETVYGFSSSKSRTLPFPSWLDNPLPFLRGFLDGDGYIGHGCTFTTGSRAFAQGLLDWVWRAYWISPNVQMVGVNKDVYNITFRKKHEDFIRHLFSYAGLTRKTIAFNQYLPN